MPPTDSNGRSKETMWSNQELLQKWDSVGEYTPADRSKPSLQRRLAVRLELTLAWFAFLLSSFWILMKAIPRLFTPRFEQDISGKIALVSGGANGLGRELCLELTRQGARVVVVDVDSRAARATADDLRRLAGREDVARAYTADVSKPLDVNRLRKEILADWGRSVDILVNNAGLLTPVSLLNCDDAVIDRIVDVNLKSHFWMLRAFLPEMMARNEGQVLCISSMAALFPLSRACVYTATKFGVSGLSAALQAELRDKGVDGVRVTIAYPYFLATRKELMDNIDLRIPALLPEEAARLIVQGMRRRQLRVSVPSNFSGSFIGLFPDEVQENFRKTFAANVKE